MITGGEPMLQLDEALVEALHERGFPRRGRDQRDACLRSPGLDWICVSPKAGTEVVQREGNELKLVWPQDGIDPAELESWDVRPFPRAADGLRASGEAALKAAISLAMERPKWRLSLQAHKVVGLP